MDNLAHLARNWIGAPHLPSAVGSHRQRVLTLGHGMRQIWVIPQRVAGFDIGKADKVIGAGRHGVGPLQRIGIPGVMLGRLAKPKVQRDIQQHHGNPCREHKAADRREQVKNLPARPCFIGVNPPGHTEQPGPVHDQEGAVKAQESKPKPPAPQVFGGHSPGEERQPIVKPGDQREEHAPHQHVVHVSHYKVGVVHLPVKRHQRQHDAG